MKTVQAPTRPGLRVPFGRAGLVLAAGLSTFALSAVISASGTRAQDGARTGPAPVVTTAQGQAEDAAPPAGGDQAELSLAAGRVVYAYWAKLVCGVQKDPEELRLARGAYATVINIGNPGESTVKLTKTLALAIPPGFQRPGPVERIATDELPAGAALATDCEDIRRRLFPEGFPAPYVEGFVVIRSLAPLEVTGVYSTGSLDEKGNVVGNGGIEIEPVAARLSRPRPAGQPDLVVSAIGAPRVSCPGGGGTCVTRVEVTVANVGAAAAGPFKLQVVLDPAASVVVTVDSTGLAAGASQSFAIITPPGGNCYDPDCSICATADSAAEVPESDETNNTLCNSTIG